MSVSGEQDESTRELLARLNHQFKNYQQLVASLVSLQVRRAENDETRLALEDLRARIDAATHIQSSLGEERGVKVRLESFLPGIGARIAQNYDSAGRHHVSFDIAPLELETRQAALLGQILSELLINCYRHAFSEGGSAAVALRRLPDARFEMRVADDGPGAPFSSAAIPKDGRRLGLGVVASLSRGLGGSFRIGEPPGFSGTVIFPVDDAAADRRS